MVDRNRKVRSRRGGGRNARRASRREKLAQASKPYIERKIPYFEYLNEESLDLIEKNADIADIRTTHFAYDLTSSREDPSCVFPLTSLRECVARGKIKSLAEHAVTFMGGIYSHRKVREILAPSIRNYFIKQEVDLAILVPV